MIVVGGISHLYQGDLDIGRHAVARIAGSPLPPDVVVEDFDYGAVAVVQRLEELRPGGLVLLGAVERGGKPGTVRRREIGASAFPPGTVRNAVADAVTGYITLDLLVEVAAGLGALPALAVALEVEPELTGPSESLSLACEAALDELVAQALAEVRALWEALSASLPADSPPPPQR